MNTNTIKALNEFLEGNYMAIHAYEDFIEHIDHPQIKKSLQEIQQGHKEHAAKISERIQNLGGVPVNDVGLKGKMVEFMKNFTSTSHGTNEILKDALKGEERGISVSRDLVKGDLDTESLQIVQSILNHDEKHVELLHQFIQEQKK